jgi:hypothetical protein
MVRVVGKLGLDGEVPFTQVVSTGGEEVKLHYTLDTGGNPEVLAAVEMLSTVESVGRTVALQEQNGGFRELKLPFENRAGVTSITFFSGSRRVFLGFSAPVTIGTTQGEGGGEISWRVELRAADRATTPAIDFAWSANSREKQANVSARLKRATTAEENEEFGKAAAAYRDFIKNYPRYARERRQAEQRLRAVQSEIQSRVDAVARLAERARTSKNSADYLAAERACSKLLDKLGSTAAADDLKKTLAKLQAERRAIIRKQREAEARDFIDKATKDIELQNYNTARARLEYVIEKFPDTAFERDARELLEKLPKQD